MNEGKNGNRSNFYVTTSIWRMSLSSYAKLVFAYLCYCSNREGVSCPSQEKISETCGISRSSAKRAIAELKEGGLITFENRNRSDKGRNSNLYRLNNRFIRKIGDGAKSNEQDCAEDDRELEKLIKEIGPEYLLDKEFARAVEDAIREMWRAGSVRVAGKDVPRSEVRKRLGELDIYSVEMLEDKLKNMNIKNASAYLRSCIYNAPAEYRACIAVSGN